MSDPKDIKLTAQARVVGVRPAPPAITEHLRHVRFEPSSTGVRFVGAHIERVDFSGLRIDRYHASDSVFEGCDFRRTVLRGTFGVPPPSVYRDCLFDSADLRQCSPGLARFERCIFDGAKLDGWLSWHAEFVDCRFSGRLKTVVFSAGLNDDPTRGPVRTEALEFRGNDFHAADLVEVSFSGGIDIGAQVLPEGPEYVRLDVRPETLDRVDAFVGGLPPDQRDGPFGAASTVRGIRLAYRSQSQAFLKRGSTGRLDLYERLLSTLRTH